MKQTSMHCGCPGRRETTTSRRGFLKNGWPDGRCPADVNRQQSIRQRATSPRATSPRSANEMLAEALHFVHLQSGQ